ncbi:protein of unknown function [Filomicrobium insigne]|jgi:hypothetical protein|uniref:DUF4437 domain-containing protein n=1 Tax=Filomicrobium insigne TaxID=418854 RepID=A0A1H0JMW4_9HYPH|nr:DUF4437 domain-containing protein [Filomicrobium insigne]SDO45108.1 protein of unknown function [Filomicrobium insigne]
MTTTIIAFSLALLAFGFASAPALAEDKFVPSTIKSAADYEWQEFAPGTPLTFVPLWGDRSSDGEYAILLKLPAGFSSGTHAHTHDYHGINIQGAWVHTDRVATDEKGLPPGSLVTQPGLSMHADHCKGPEDCILLIYQKGKSDFIPKPKSAN